MEATTDAGKKVLLDSDGTWRFVEPVTIDASNEGFRRIPWGASRTTISERETLDLVQRIPDGLMYHTPIAGLSCNVVYILVDDQLVRAKYMLDQEYENQNNYLAATDKLKASLETKYGAPDRDNSYWSDDLYKDEVNDWGMAVSCGHLTRFVFWETAATTICLYLTGENFEIDVGIEYTSKALEHLEQSQKDAQIIADL
jgi:hypothetical protein